MQVRANLISRWCNRVKLVGIIFNRPCVAGAVLQTSLSFIMSVSQSVTLFLPIFKTTQLPNRQSQGPEIFTQCSPTPMCYVSCVTGRMSHVTCQMSLVTTTKKRRQWWIQSVEVLLSTGPTLSSFFPQSRTFCVVGASSRVSPAGKFVTVGTFRFLPEELLRRSELSVLTLSVRRSQFSGDWTDPSLTLLTACYQQKFV